MGLRAGPQRPPFLLPPHGAGQRIGLLGGSFNPPHDAHLLISLIALRRLRLDQVWWLVTPGNPLKDNRELPELASRMAACRRLARHPRIRVTDLELRIGSRFTLDTIEALVRRAPSLRFVWLMGADNLAQFHRWRGWRRIAALTPIAVIDRPGDSWRALRSPAAQSLDRRRLPERRAATLAEHAPPAWCFLHGKRSSLSSTLLRRAGRGLPLQLR